MANVKDALTRHAHFVERYKTAEASKIDKYLRRIDKVIRDNLTRIDKIKSAKQLAKIQLKVRKEIYEIYKEWAKEMRINLVNFAASEAGFAARAIGKGLKIPSKSMLAAAIKARPFQTKLLREALADFTRIQSVAVKNAISAGFYQGLTTPEIVRTIRGTKAANYKDGLLVISRNSASRIVRTAINHTSSVARVTLLQENSDLFSKYEWVSTLDARTSDICKKLDGKTYSIKSGRMPPAHYNCRSTIIPVLNNEL